MNLRKSVYMKMIGAKVQIKWDKEEVATTGWRGGWYTATVNGYCEETDEITILLNMESLTQRSCLTLFPATRSDFSGHLFKLPCVIFSETL